MSALFALLDPITLNQLNGEELRVPVQELYGTVHTVRTCICLFFVLNQVNRANRMKSWTIPFHELLIGELVILEELVRVDPSLNLERPTE
jgi:hypothetical protein